MMMNRKRLGRVMAVFAIVLAAFFLLSSVLMGLGTNVQYNLIELLGGQQDQPQQDQGPTPKDAIRAAENDLRQNPNDPDAITDLAAVYYQNGRYDDAAGVLREGREKAPNDAEIPALLGAVYQQQAAGVEPNEQKELYAKAGDAFAAAAEKEDDEDLYLQAGQSYDEADQPAEAIKYYNAYLDLEPEGRTSEQVKDRIAALLEGGAGGDQP